MDQSEDEGFQSASNLTPDSQSEPSPIPDVDMWEALHTFEPGKRRCWESVGWYVTATLLKILLQLLKSHSSSFISNSFFKLILNIF